MSKLPAKHTTLERESLDLFLRHRLRLVESQRLNPAQESSVQTVAELDELAQGSHVHKAEILAYSRLITWKPSQTRCPNRRLS